MRIIVMLHKLEQRGDNNEPTFQVKNIFWLVYGFMYLSQPGRYKLKMGGWEVL